MKKLVLLVLSLFLVAGCSEPPAPKGPTGPATEGKKTRDNTKGMTAQPNEPA